MQKAQGRVLGAVGRMDVESGRDICQFNICTKQQRPSRNERGWTELVSVRPEPELDLLQ